MPLPVQINNLDLNNILPPPATSILIYPNFGFMIKFEALLSHPGSARIYFLNLNRTNIPVPNGIVCRNLTTKKDNPQMPSTTYFMVNNQTKYVFKYFGLDICGVTTG